MAVEGTLDLFKLPEILQLVSQQKKTGILTVQGQQDIVAISFLNGRIVAADALNQTLEEGLSQILVKEGMISVPDLARAASEHQASGGRLIDLLVERRYVERAQILEALRLQTSRLLEQLLRWSQGDFKFYSGDEVSYEEGFAPISVEELLINAGPGYAAAAAEKAAATAAAAPPRPVPLPAPAAAPPPRSQAVAPARPAPPAAVPRPVPPPAPVSANAPMIPPDDLESAGPFRKMKVEARPVPPPSLGWVGRSLAVLLAVLVIATLLRLPDSLLLPFPWQQHEREALVRDQRASLYLKIDRAAKTWYLLKGSFPDHLQDLVTAGLLSPADLKDPEGRPLRYTAAEDSYTLGALERGRPMPGAEATEAITGNFLLDPEVLSSAPESTAPPLVLLD
jgi:hypothetical protein